MKALITGASSGIGREMARCLSNMGYDLILVARRIDRLEEVKKELKTKVEIFPYDLEIADNCYELYDKLKNKEIQIVINNAGFGDFGDYANDNLKTELKMIDLNVKCLHILTKLFVNNKNVKYIMNVASSAGLLRGGPLMSCYYATKSYVCNYSFAIYEELRRNKADKYISVLCPGPVNTEFNNRAGVKFNLKSLQADEVAEYAVKKMFKKKLIIIPGITVKLGVYFSRLLPTKLLLRITYKIQERKNNTKKNQIDE